VTPENRSVGKDTIALAGKLIATAPWLSWSEALKRAKEAVRELLGRVESAPPRSGWRSGSSGGPWPLARN